MKKAVVARAVECLRTGGLVAYPTETVWGLAADATSETAVTALRRFKGRTAAQPVSLLVSGLPALEKLSCAVPEAARALAAAFWPGPLTLVLPCQRFFARGVARADGAVGVRCSSHAWVQTLVQALEQAGIGPVTSTSLNRSGESPATSWRETQHLLCRESFRFEAELFCLGEEAMDAGSGLASSIVDLSGVAPRLLRLGAIPRGALEDVLGMLFREQPASVLNG